MRDSDLTSRELSQMSSAAVLMDREWAPCRYSCPVHADVRAYVEHAAMGRWREAIDAIREHLPFAAVCGRICHHPCETECRRTDVDDPVAIREVKRFVAELQGAAGATVHKAASQDKAKVAVVGAGPAGFSAALDLAKMGYRPTVFEKFPVAGGICATAIPKYRLPREVIQIDIDWICAHGVELVTGVEIGKDKTIDQLRDEGFRAVLVAAGLANSRMLPLPGFDHPRVRGVIDFLTDLAFDRSVDVGDDVLVIGGGNVACDAARSAVRLGARRVRMICLENEAEMPAWSWEQDESLEEGVTFIHRRGPVEIKIADGRIVGLKARKVTRVFDADDRFDPQYDDGDTVDLECDTVIVAIGQAADTGFVAGSGLELDGRGRLRFDPATHRTNVPDVFACGEIVTAPGSAVEACANGQRAAEAIDLHLRGRKIEIDDSLPPYIEKIAPETAEKVLKVPRASVPTDSPEARRKNFEQIDHSLSAAATLCESRRCMSCGSGAEVLTDKCAACLTCLRICPFDIPKVTDVARIESALCQACGMCIAACPANAIVPRGWDAGDLVGRARSALAKLPDGKKIVAYVCGFHASAEDWNGRTGDGIPGVAEVYLPSLARLGVNDLLYAFENGADGVVVVACGDDSGRYPGVADRVRRYVEQARELLAEIGADGEKVQMSESAGDGRDAVRAALTEAAAKI